MALRDDDAYWLDQLTVLSGPQSAIESAAGYNPDLLQTREERRPDEHQRRWAKREKK